MVLKNVYIKQKKKKIFVYMEEIIELSRHQIGTKLQQTWAASAH